jgi:HJR/Mrr/RecB family endonuclease
MTGIISSIKEFFFDSSSTASKIETKAEKDARHRNDALAFVKHKQHQANNPRNQYVDQKNHAESSHTSRNDIKNTLAFVKQKHRDAHAKQSKQEAWHRQYGKQKAAELSQLSGAEFEEFLAGLFRQHGYQVELTPTTGDYGADLLLTKAGQCIAVQAKCYTGSVGVSAVQEALAGMAYYGCQSAWVVTTGNLTPNAIALAKKSQVRLVDSTELGKLIKYLEVEE